MTTPQHFLFGFNEACRNSFGSDFPLLQSNVVCLALLVDSRFLSTLRPAGQIFVLPDYKAASCQRLLNNITGRFKYIQVLLRQREM